MYKLISKFISVKSTDFEFKIVKNRNSKNGFKKLADYWIISLYLAHHWMHWRMKLSNYKDFLGVSNNTEIERRDGKL